MTTELIASLVVLSLIDSTSFGTLLIPIWLMLAPGRVRTGRIVLFLATVAGFYLVVGLALVSGLAAVLRDTDALLANPVVIRAQLVVGIGLFVWSFFIGRKRSANGRRSSGRLLRWRDQAMAEAGGRRGRTGRGWTGLVGLALGAAVLEVATMLPYLAATGLISSTDLGPGQRFALLAGYCLVMIAPALVLLLLRVVASRWVEPALVRIAAWMERSGAEATAWIVGIVGFLVARDAASRMPELLSIVSLG